MKGGKRSLPSDDDGLAHDGQLLHHRRHRVEGLAGKRDDIVVLRNGKGGLGGRARVVLADGDREVIRLTSALGVGGIDRNGDLLLADNVALKSASRDREGTGDLAADGDAGSEAGGETQGRASGSHVFCRRSG